MRAVVVPLTIAGLSVMTFTACGPGRGGAKENAELKKALSESKRAVTAAETEASLYDIAQIYSSRILREELSASSYREAESYLREGLPSYALAKLMRSYRHAPSNNAAIIRAVNLLNYRNFAKPLVRHQYDQRPLLVRFSSDSQRVALVGEGGLAQLFDAKSLQPIAVAFKHEGMVRGLAFSPDSSLLVTADELGAAKLWDANTGQARGVFNVDGSVSFLEFSRNGRRLLTTTEDHSVTVWDIVTGRPIAAPEEFGGRFRAARLHPDGKSIAVAVGTDVQFWNVDTGKASPLVIKGGSTVDFLEFSADGEKLLVSSGREVSLYATSKGQRLCGPILHDTSLTAARLDPRGTRILTAAEDFAVRMWDAGSGEPVGEPMPHKRIVRDIRFSKDGTLLITASYDQSARVWELETGQPFTEPMRHIVEVETADLNPDGTLAVTASQLGILRFWDVRDGRLRSLPIPAISGLDAVQLLPDREIVVSTPEDEKTLRLWDAVRQTQVGADIRMPSAAVQVLISPDGRLLITRGMDQTLRIWDTKTGQPLGKPLDAAQPPERLTITPDSSRLVAVFGDTILTVDLADPLLRSVELKHDAAITDFAISEDGKQILTGSVDGAVRLWNVTTAALAWPAIKRDVRINAVAFDPNGGRFITACDDGAARLYQVANGQPVGQRMRHIGPVLCAAFSVDGRLIATGGSDGAARLWDAETTAEEDTNFRHTEPVWRVQIDSSGRWLQASAGGLRTELVPKLWDIEAGRAANLPSGLVLKLGFDPRERRIFAGFAEGKTLLVDTKSGRVSGLPLVHDGALSAVSFSSDGSHILTTSWDATGRLWSSDTGLPLTDPIAHEQPVTDGTLSADGQRIVTVESERDIRVWELGPVNDEVPEWFPRLVEALTGATVNDAGSVVAVDYDRPAVIEEIRAQLAAAPEEEPWTRWGRWFLGDLGQRTISPVATVTIPQYIEKLIARNTLESLREASRLAAGNMPLTQIINLRRAALMADLGEPTAQ